MIIDFRLVVLLLMGRTVPCIHRHIVVDYLLPLILQYYPEQCCHTVLLSQHRETRGRSCCQPWQLLQPRQVSDSERAFRCIKVSCNQTYQDDSKTNYKQTFLSSQNIKYAVLTSLIIVRNYLIYLHFGMILSKTYQPLRVSRVVRLFDNEKRKFGNFNKLHIISINSLVVYLFH